MPNWINKSTIYTFGWLLYATQGIFLPKGSLFTQLLIVSLIAYSLYYVFIANVRYRLSPYFQGLNVLLVMFTLYGVYLLITYDPAEYVFQRDPSIYLKKIYISLLPIYVYYVFFKEKFISEKALIVWFFIFLVAMTGQFFHRQHELLMFALMKDGITNNYGYVFLAFIPACVILYKKVFLQYITLGYCMVFIFMGMKRGAIVISILCLLFFLWKNIKVTNIGKKIGLLILSSLLCFIVFLFVQKQLEESLYFQKRIEQTVEGNASGREELYTTFANYFLNDASPLQFVFGSGADATLKVSYNYAHNDWLEIAVNQGILGVMIYLLYWFLFAKEISSKSYSQHIRLIMQLLFIIYFMRTIFSMSYSEMSIFSTLIFGYCLAQRGANEQIVYCYKIN